MHFRSIIGWLLAALLASGACTVRDDGEALEAEQPQSLSLGVGAKSSSTKALPGVITEMLSTNDNPNFRGLSNIRIIPFFTGLGINVRPTDQANGYSRLFPDIEGSANDVKVYNGNHFHSGLLKGSHAHYFSGGHALFSSGTTAMLVYARATEPELPEEAMALRTHKQKYGALSEKGWTGKDDSYPTPADIGFSPEAIYGDDISVVATKMAKILTEVASTSVSVQYYYHSGDPSDLYPIDYASAVWNDDNLDCPGLRQAFSKFASLVEKEYQPLEEKEYQLIPGAYVNLMWRLNILSVMLQGDCTCEDGGNAIKHGDQDALINETTTLKKRDVHNALRKNLRDNVQKCIEDLDDYSQYPQAYGIPSGASFLRWNGDAFQAVPEAIDGWIPATQYCYMPALYYYSNSTLSTSYSSDIYEQYTGKTWEQIKGLYTAGKMVTKSTRAVVLDTPLQFACGMLVATIKAKNSQLFDEGEVHKFDLDDFSKYFPVTGMIIGGQYDQHYDFTPVADDATEEVHLEKFMYDNFANKYPDEMPGPYVNTAQSAPFRTLVLPTPLEKSVYFYLELRNDTGTDFNGADGVVIPAGSKFYLAGEIPAPSSEDITNGVNRVFMQDRYTQVTCQVESLKNAYLCIPQMGNPELRLGVQTKTNWYFSPSSYVVLG